MYDDMRRIRSRDIATKVQDRPFLNVNKEILITVRGRTLRKIAY